MSSAGVNKGLAAMHVNTGADVNAQGDESGTTLQAASIGGHEELAEMLTEKALLSTRPAESPHELP